jgi:hypothetical protein
MLTGFFALGLEVAAAAPRECGFEALDPELPSYARAGGVIDIPVNDYSNGRQQYSGTVRVAPAGAEAQTYPLEVTDTRKASWGGLEGHIRVPAPAQPNRSTRVVLAWIEKDSYPSGYTSECAGGDAATIPIVPPGGEVGDPSYPRLEGRFRVFYRLQASGIPGIDKSDRAIWRLRPRCRYFACSTTLRSTLGLRGTFFPRLTGRIYNYSLSKYSGPLAYCSGTTVNRFTGEVIDHWKIRRAYRGIREVSLTAPEDPRLHRVRTFTGKSVFHFEPIRSAKRRGCPDKYIVERIRGRLIRG